ncbi:MAG: S-layer homology domain-containing protein [Defluviitaleaceae bacterium]|nr:S-layer homology domain-containing protein [Defluviitaleaceae bacterium]
MSKILAILAVCATAILTQDVFRVFTAVYVDGQFVKYARPAVEMGAFGWQVEYDQGSNPFIYAPAGEDFWITMEGMPFFQFINWQGGPTPRFSGIPPLYMQMPHHDVVVRGNFDILYRVLINGEELQFAANTPVTLPALTREGYRLAGWQSPILIHENGFVMPPGAYPGQIVATINPIWMPIGGQAPPQQPPSQPQPPAIPDDERNGNYDDGLFDDRLQSGLPVPSLSTTVRLPQQQLPQSKRTPKPMQAAPPPMHAVVLPVPACYAAILGSKGILNAFSAGYFAPNQPISRATFLHAVINAHYFNNGSTFSIKPAGFLDVSESAWYYPVAIWAVSVGLVENDGNFRPHDIVTAQEAHGMLRQYLEIVGHVACQATLPQQLSQSYLTRGCAAAMLVHFFGI